MFTYELKKYMNARENISIIQSEFPEPGCPPHVHEFAELIFVTDGTSTQIIDETKYEVIPGDLLFVNYKQTHSFTMSEDFRYYNLLYVPEFFSTELINSDNIYEIFEISLFSEFEELSNRNDQIVHFQGNEFLSIKQLVEEMYSEFLKKETGYRAVLNGYSRVLFSKILRKLKEERTKQNEISNLDKLTAECIAYIDANCFEKISLKKIAEKTFYKPSYLSRVFKTHCGKSLSEYVKEKRIIEAGRLLQSTDSSVEKIMRSVGYTDKKQFYKNFKEFYMLTPTEYRNKLNSNEKN